MRWWRVISRFGDVYEPIPGETPGAALTELHRLAEIEVEHDQEADRPRFACPMEARLCDKLGPWRFEELWLTGRKRA